MEVNTPVVKKQRMSKVKTVPPPTPVTIEPTMDDTNIPEDDEKKVIKRRGRKPKGGKIVQLNPVTTPIIVDKPNILIQLKCSKNDLPSLQDNNIGTFQFQTTITNDCLQLEDPSTPHYNDNYFMIHSKESTDTIPIEHNDTYQSFTFTKNTNKQVSSSSTINSSNNTTCQPCKCEYNNQMTKKMLLKKLNDLSVNLHKNNVDKKSACFWCTYNFDTPVIYIPKYNILDQYYVYGCFCSPECAFAYLMNENIDTATKFERYQLLNYIYKSMYMYTNNIKPAPNPYYMLDKYYGNLTIQEYRSLFQTDRLFLIVDKPMTKMMPEMVEDNDEFILNKKLIPSGNYQIKRGSTKRGENKRDIITENFGC